MAIKQLTVFVQNKRGRLAEITGLLAERGINMNALSIADTQEFGILRLIVGDWERAMKLLQEAGCVVRIAEVVATEIDDRPGGLAYILGILEEANVNIEYMYAFTFHKADKAILVFRFDNPDAAVQILQDKGVNMFDGVDLYNMN